MTRHALTVMSVIALSTPSLARGEAPARPLAPVLPPPAAASGASGTLDPVAATRAYLDELPREKRERSDAYFEGGYWLQLWGFLYGAAVQLLLLGTGFSARMRDASGRVRWRALQPVLYWFLFSLTTTLLGLPLSVYQDWWREHQYGLSNLTFAAWSLEQVKGLLVSALIGGLGVGLFYAVARRVRGRLWVWGSAVVMAVLAFTVVITPVWITPIFNSPKKLQHERVVGRVLSLARANGIAAGEVWEIDASRQTTRISANVSGWLGTERITLNDNLLNRASLPEIEAVMAHEMGHYVLNHIYKLLLQLGVIVLLGFWAVTRLFEKLRVRFEARWKVQDIADPAGLPLLMLLFSAYLFLMTPVVNTVIRVQEQEADLYGINASGQPDGAARAALKASEYRKMEPGPIEEAIFYDHPSGRTRIFTAMRWKAEHPVTWTPPAAAAAPTASPGAVRR
jgi:STE24 endopeptidase